MAGAKGAEKKKKEAKEDLSFWDIAKKKAESAKKVEKRWRRRAVCERSRVRN